MAARSVAGGQRTPCNDTPNPRARRPGTRLAATPLLFSLTDCLTRSRVFASGSVELTGKRGNPLNARYDIPIGDHDDFFEAYIAALRTAMLDLTIEHPGVVTAIDEAFEETVATLE